MEPHAPKAQKTLFDFGCTKRKRTAADEGSPNRPRELRTRLEPSLAARVQQQEQGQGQARGQQGQARGQQGQARGQQGRAQAQA
eukprot:822494-Pelagomonas_calceolata.AAC.8